MHTNNKLGIFHSVLLGDEILAVNGTPLQGLSHAEAISVFKSIRNGHVVVHAARRDSKAANNNNKTR